MNWLPILFLSILLGSISTILQRVLMKDEETDSAATAILFQLLAFIFLLLIGFFTNQLDFTGAKQISPNLLIAMVLIGSFYIFLFKSLKGVDASEFTIIQSSRPLFTIISSTLILAEGLVLKQFLGLALIITAIFVMTLDRFRFKFSRYEFYALLSSAALGFAVTNDRFALGRIQLIPYLILATPFTTIFIAATNWKSVKKIKTLIKKYLFGKLVLMSFFQVSSTLTFLMALQMGKNSSQISSISDLGVLVTIFMGVVFLKETNKLFKKIIAGIISVIGLMFIG